MAGAVDKKIVEVKEELDKSPTTHLSARTGIIDAVTLIREFSETHLQPLTEKFTSSTGSYSLSQVCENLARQRAICYGARDIQTAFKKFDFPAYETINGPLGLTEPNTSFMGVTATDISETYTINLTSLAGTQTVGDNTFSTDVRDYYLVRSRETGELVDVNDDVEPYTIPNGDTAFGNAIAWGEDVESEKGTWNYNYAKANIASITTKNENLYNELNVMTLQDHLEQGSNTQYSTAGPAFGQKYYLKRHADHVNTFTIIGTTTEGSLEITDVSETDLGKLKYGDVISGTGIPDDNVTIAAVKTADLKLRLSETGIATANGTINLTVNSIPFGYQAHDIFCQIEVVGEGLVINPNWKPVGDDAGDYSGAHAGPDDILTANTENFIGLLGFFNPDNGSSNATNDLTKGARGDWVSSGKEYGGAYPYKELNPFFPAIGSTRKPYEVDTGEIVGTQPTGLGEDDIPSGRYIKFDYERANNTSVMPENRYYVDQAEKFYYELPCNSQYVSGTVTIGTTHPMPNTGEPIAAIGKTGLSGAVTRVTSNTVTIASHAAGNAAVTMNVQATLTGDVPIDDNTTHPTLSGSSGNPPSWNASYYTLVNNWIYKNYVHIQSTSQPGGSGTAWTATLDTDKTAFPCRYNYAQKKLYEAGGTANSTMNADVKFIQDTVDDLQAIDAFRDPVITGAHLGASGISDSAFDTYIASEPDGDLTNLQDACKSFRDAWGAGTNSRTGDDNGNANKGEVVSMSNTTIAAFMTEVTTFGTNCSKRVAEIDARIGVPTRAGTPSTVYKQYPAVYVSTVPTANTTGGHVPYGRAIYNSCNHLLGNHLRILVQLIQDIQVLDNLVDLVKKARNKYEIYNGRAKEY